MVNKTSRPILLLLLLQLVLLIHAIHLRMITDDAFISFRYARNLAEGHGLVWNAGEAPVEGYTNFLWVLILSLLSNVGIDLVLASQILGIVSAMATLSLVTRTSLSSDKSDVPNLLAVCVLAFSGSFASWTTSGLETSFFTFLIFSGFYYYLNQKLYHSAFLFFLATLTRPEGLLVFLIVVVYHFRAQQRSTLKFFLFFIVPFSIYFAWRYFYFGYPLPNTFYMKVGGTVWQIVRGMKYFLGFLGVTVLPLLVFVRPFLGRLTESERLSFWILGCYALYIILVGGDYMAMFRFFVPLLPWIALLAASVIRILVDRISVRRQAMAGLALYALFAIYLLPSFPLERARAFLPLPQIYWNIRYDSYPRLLFERWQVNRLSAIGKWLKEQLPAGSSLACQGIGAIGYYSELTIHDLNGLTIVQIAHKKVDRMGKGVAGHEKEDFLHVLSLKPDYILASRYLSKTGEPETFEEIYDGKLFHYSVEEQKQIIRTLNEEYLPDFRPFQDHANQETGFLRLLRRKP